ncbi:hypothetical protein COOONC_23743 [Cooperia oncophora]
MSYYKGNAVADKIRAAFRVTSSTVPRYTETCAGDLLGHIFWVPCDPRKIVEAEYGPTWYNDHPTTNFSWNGSPFNVKDIGKWSKSEMPEVYKIYT